MRIECQNCGELVTVPNGDEPLSYVTREATADEPKSFLIMEAGDAGHWLLHRCVITDGRDAWSASPLVSSNEVHLASGMVAAQAHCSFAEAVALMQAHADAAGQTLDEISADVLERRLRFG